MKQSDNNRDYMPHMTEERKSLLGGRVIKGMQQAIIRTELEGVYVEM